MGLYRSSIGDNLYSLAGKHRSLDRKRGRGHGVYESSRIAVRADPGMR